MITPTVLTQLKAFARQDGLLLGLYWTTSFILVVSLPQSIIGSLLALATPVFLGWRLCCFRDFALDGVISFRRGFAYCIYTTFYASLLFALIQFIYFRFIDHGRFFSLLSENMDLISQVYVQNGMSVSNRKEAMAELQSLPPVA